MPPFEFGYESPLIRQILTEVTLMKMGYTYKDIKEMSITGAFLRDFICNKSKLISQTIQAGMM